MRYPTLEASTLPLEVFGMDILPANAEVDLQGIGIRNKRGSRCDPNKDKESGGIGVRL